MLKAEHTSIIVYPGEKYSNVYRRWNGCPSMEVTGSRIWATFFTGGCYEPSKKNHAIVIYSDDGGKTWVDPYIAVTGDENACYRTMDPQLWKMPDGRLMLSWMRMHYPENIPETDYSTGGEKWLMDYFDRDSATCASFCSDPESEKPVWSEPVVLFDGVLRNKPTVLSDGTWFMPAYDANRADAENYVYRISRDNGRTFETRNGPARIKGDTCPFEEPIAVEFEKGHIKFYVRTMLSCIAMGESFDYGKTWSDTQKLPIPNPSTRFYIKKLPSGRLLLVNTPNAKLGDRTGLIAYLSEDGGDSWKHSLVLDERRSTTYPDGSVLPDGSIMLIYDVQRDNRQEIDKDDPTLSHAAKEIMLTRFTEEDIISGAFVSGVSKKPYAITKVTNDRL